MPDMLVPLLQLPPLSPVLDELSEIGITIRRANTFESSLIREFIELHFSRGWADEVMPCFSRQPVTLYIAILEGKVVGFAAVEATCRNYFGPTGVAESHRGKGIGKGLLVSALNGLRELGYAYGIIGGVGPEEFYRKNVNAILIPNSTPGIYSNMLKR